MATELVDGCWWLDLGSVNAFLVVDDGVPTLVDAGTPRDVDAIRSDLAAVGVDLADVERVLVTHYDVDHVGTLSALETETEATVYAADPDAAILTGDRSPPLRNLKGVFQRVTGPFVSRPDLPVETVTDGDGVGSFRVYGTPGHTPGHVAYVSESLGVGFLGDLVVEDDGHLSPSPWYLSYDTDAVADSVRDLAERAPPFSVLGMGHGQPLDEGGDDAVDRLADVV